MVSKVVKKKLEEDGQSALYKSLQRAGLDAQPRRSVDWVFEENDRLYVSVWDVTTSERNGVVKSIIPAGKWIRNARSHTRPKAERMLDALLRYEGQQVVAILCERDKNAEEVKIRKSCPDDVPWVVQKTGPKSFRLIRGGDVAIKSDLPKFQPGKLYKRSTDIHDVFGGQRQGGISTPKDHPYVFIFTGSSGQQYGYEDGWDEDGVFVYTGEGQVGDMGFVSGNKAIRDHLQNGKEMLLFEALGKSKPVRFVGPVVCASWEHRQGPDKHGNQRKTIVFHFVSEDANDALALEDSGPPNIDLNILRNKAYSASTQSSEGKKKSARKNYYQRSKDVRDYVLARADGVCESCEKSAPFKRKDGSPYLEPHHTRRVSDGGPDHPRWVGGICPNCHREIHSGQSGKNLNESLIKKLGEIESD